MFLIYMQAEHGEVIARIGSVAVTLNFVLHGLNHLAGTQITSALNYCEQLLIAKLLKLRILSLVQAVGIYKEQFTTNIIDYLALIL